MKTKTVYVGILDTWKKTISKPSLFESRRIPSFASTSLLSVPVPVFVAGVSVFAGAVRRDGLSAPSVGVASDYPTVPPGAQGRVHVLPSTVTGRTNRY